MTNLKPGITMTLNEKITFVEITVPYEKDREVLTRREDEKERKYVRLTANDCSRCRRHIKQNHGGEVKESKHW